MSQWKFARDWAKIQLISCDRQRLERLNLPDLWYTFSSPPPCYHWHVISNAAPSHRLWNVCSKCTQPLQYVVKLGTEKSPESLSIKPSLTLNVSYSVIFGQSLVYVMIPLQSVAAPLQHSFSISIVFHDSSQTINIILFIGHRKISTSMVFSSSTIIWLGFKIVMTLFASLLIMKLKWCFCYLLGGLSGSVINEAISTVWCLVKIFIMKTWGSLLPAAYCPLDHFASHFYN